MSDQPNNWRRHEFRGWVCVCCGYVARCTTARNVHDRRALRGLGCSPAANPVLSQEA